jgi:hypothetical protein
MSLTTEGSTGTGRTEHIKQHIDNRTKKVRQQTPTQVQLLNFFSDTCQRHFHQQTVWKIGQLQKTITSTMNDELPVMLVGFLRDLSRATSPSGYLLLALFAFPCLASVQIAQ